LPWSRTISTSTARLHYEAFPAAEARRLVERFGWHYTPKHGSWLDLAESERGVLSSQCLDRRIPDKKTLIDEITAWENDRNAHHAKANWHFTTPNARIKLKHLYPSIWMNRATSLLAAGTARPEDIAIAAASPTELDDHMMTLALDARVQDLTTVV
jgi:hypothetical protein